MKLFDESVTIGDMAVIIGDPESIHRRITEIDITRQWIKVDGLEGSFQCGQVKHMLHKARWERPKGETIARGEVMEGPITIQDLLHMISEQELKPEDEILFRLKKDDHAHVLIFTDVDIERTASSPIVPMGVAAPLTHHQALVFYFEDENEE